MGKRIIEVPVSSNGRMGFCPKCSNRNVPLGDINFPNGGRKVASVNCPSCIIKDEMLQARILVSVGASSAEEYSSIEYRFVRA